jgi:hypothetical protein
LRPPTAISSFKEGPDATVPTGAACAAGADNVEPILYYCILYIIQIYYLLNIK